MPAAPQHGQYKEVQDEPTTAARLSTALTLSAALLAPTAAFAAQTTIHFTHTESRAELNPCSGAPGTLTIMLSVVMHTTPGNAIVTNAENVVVHGSDGSLGKQHILVHHTVNANGTVTSSIEIMEFSCLAR